MFPKRREERVYKSLADFPDVAVGMATKLAAWVERDDIRRVVTLAYCLYWAEETDPPPIPRPGEEEYELQKYILQRILSPVIIPCTGCGWPRAEGDVCYYCGDGNKEG